MATNNFKAFGIGAGANVTSQSDYEALAALLTGFQSGKASSAQINKALRQSTTMANVLAQFISDSASVDVLDNGTPATILTNLKLAMTSLTPGRLLNVQVITASGTYTPTAGTNKIFVRLVGGGGGGAGGIGTGTTSTISGGSGGGGGGFAMRLLTSGFSGVQMTIGTGGAGGSRGSESAAKGSDGGSTSFGSLVVATGGKGGSTQTKTSSDSLNQQLGGSPGAGTVGDLLGSGQPGGRLLHTSYANSTSGDGGGSLLSLGPRGPGGSTIANGIAGTAGAGGSGGINTTGDSSGANGGAGGNGVIIIEEYA